MLLPPANAQPQDFSASGLMTILICAALMLGVLGLALVPLAIARRRNLPTQNLLVGIIVWALIACGSLISAALNQMQFEKDYMSDLQSGYLNPSDMSGAPTWPWILWIALAVVYAGMLIGACVRRRGGESLKS
jgi:hypothetical protein